MKTSSAWSRPIVGGCHSFWFGKGLINTIKGKLMLWFTGAELFTGIVEVVDMDCFNPTDS